jgi:hypothetical protein
VPNTKDRTIYSLYQGRMTPMNEARLPSRTNFVITCAYGDWSGFRTLAECEKQFPELEARGKENFYFNVVER